MHRDRPLWLALIGNTYFFGIAALIQLVIVHLRPEGRHARQRSSPEQVILAGGARAIGIGLGCFLAGYLLRREKSNMARFDSIRRVRALDNFRRLMGHSGSVVWRGDGQSGSRCSDSSRAVFISCRFQRCCAAPARRATRRGRCTCVLPIWLSFIAIALASGAYWFYLFSTVLKLSPPLQYFWPSPY